MQHGVQRLKWEYKLMRSAIGVAFLNIIKNKMSSVKYGDLYIIHLIISYDYQYYSLTQAMVLGQVLISIVLNVTNQFSILNMNNRTIF